MKRRTLCRGASRFSFFSLNEPSDAQMEQILELIDRPVEKGRRVLGGRRTVTLGTVSGIGDVAVKHFVRGGLLGRFVSRWYVRTGPVRAEIEYRLMRHVRELGVSAPEPIAFVSQGGIVYRTWLVSRAVSPHQTLAELSTRDPDQAEAAIASLIPQLEILIENKVYHVDLHPGNVLVGEDRRAVLIDFDKARHFTGTRNTLRDRYICRWRRAVLKHELPELLCEHFCAGLRRHFPEPASVESLS